MSSDPLTATRWWTRPEAIALNRLPMTTFLRDASDVVALDGRWSFTLLDRPGGAVRAEATVEVPGCWTMQGVGDPPQYTNIQMPFAGPPPHVPDDNPTGVYRRQVDVPARLGRPAHRAARRRRGVGAVRRGRRRASSAWAPTPGCRRSSTSPASVTPGRPCELTLTVVRWSAATYLEDQDHWYHAGLHRSVFLYSTPRGAPRRRARRRRSGPGDRRGSADRAGDHRRGPCATDRSVRLTLDGVAVGQAPARWEHADTCRQRLPVRRARCHGRPWTSPRCEPWSAEQPAPARPARRPRRTPDGARARRGRAARRLPPRRGARPRAAGQRSGRADQGRQPPRPRPAARQGGRRVRRSAATSN